MADKKYSYAIGRRKTASATVRLFDEAGENKVNDKLFNELYVSEIDQKKVVKPLVIAELDPKNYHFTAKVSGSGTSAQLEAIMLGISRAIIKLDPEKRTLLKKEGLLTRDPRMVERKKTGKRKARKSEQFSKR